MGLGEKLKALRTRCGLTQRDLASRIGVKHGHISGIENGYHYPAEDRLIQIADALGADAGPLLEQLREEKTPPHLRKYLPSQQTLDRIAPGLDRSRLIPLRRIPIISRTAAGDPKMFTDGDYPPGFANSYMLCPDDVKDPNAFALKIDGESMSPRIEHGDRVICEPSRELQNGDLCVVKVHDTETTCKFWHRYDDMVVLRSANPAYPEQTYKLEQIVWAYRVSCTIRWE